MPGYTPPQIPAVLTKKDWDKRKGTIAKMAGATGIGAECDKVAAAYKAVKWDKFDLEERVRAVLVNWASKTYTKPNWDKIVQEAKDEMTGNLTKLSAALLNLSKLCTKVGADFKKSKTIPSSSTQHVLGMAKTADQLGVALNKNSMTTVLQQQIKTFDTANARLFGEVVPSLRTVAQKQQNMIAQMRQNPTPDNFNTLAGTLRNFTQPLGNYAKMCDRGFAPPNPAALQAFIGLKPWAAINDVKLPANASPQDITTAIDKLATPHAAAIRFAATVR